MSAVRQQTYSYQRALKEATIYFQGDEFAATTWINKYALRNLKGELLECNPDQMHRRIASEIVRIEQNYPNPMTFDEVYELLNNFQYAIPGGGSLSGIGDNNRHQSLSNCFVIGIDGQEDSYGAIFRIDEEQTQLCKRRGGVGHDLSGLRPEGSLVTNAARTSSGIVSFMDRYSNSTREVGQGGR